MPKYTDEQIGRRVREIMREFGSNERRMVEVLRLMIKDEGPPEAAQPDTKVDRPPKKAA